MCSFPVMCSFPLEEANKATEHLQRAAAQTLLEPLPHNCTFQPDRDTPASQYRVEHNTQPPVSLLLSEVL